MINQINFEDIKVKDSFLKSNITKSKLIQKRKDFENNRISPIIIDNDNVLIDGYITWYLYNEKVYKGKVNVIYINDFHNELNDEEKDYDMCYYKTFQRKKKKYSYRNSPTLYIWGKYPNNENEYVWRVSSNLIDYLNIEKGDTIKVSTKFGYHYVEVTRYEILDQAPITKTIKKVKEIIKRGDN